MAKTFAIDIPLYCVRHGQIGGTEFAIYNLIQGLAAAGAAVGLDAGRLDDLSPEFVAAIMNAPNVGLKIGGGLPGPKNVRFFEEVFYELRRASANWVMYPNYFRPVAVKRRPTAVLLHDIQYKVLPQFHSGRRRAWLDVYLPWMFDNADRVLLISESERRYVDKFFGPKASSRSVVIGNAVDWDRFAQIEVPLPDPSRPYILSVCHQFPHKNLKTLLSAFAQVATRNSDVQLFLVGSQSAENEAFIRTNLPDDVARRVRLLGFVSDAELASFYRHAQVFALPSLYEGFGMPAVEALGLGVPTLASGTTALPEVTLGLAQYIADPLDVGEWADRLCEMLRHESRAPQATIDKLRAAHAPRAAAERLIQALEAGR